MFNNFRLNEQRFIINVIVYQYLRQCFDNKIRIGLSVFNQAIYYAKHFHLIVLCWNRTFIIYNIGRYLKLIEHFSDSSSLNLLLLNFNLFKLDIKMNQCHICLYIL